MDAPAGKRMTPFVGEIVEVRAFDELSISDEVAVKLCSMSAATIVRRLAADRKKLKLKGRSGTKPGHPVGLREPIVTRSVPVRDPPTVTSSLRSRST